MYFWIREPHDKVKVLLKWFCSMCTFKYDKSYESIIFDLETKKINPSPLEQPFRPLTPNGYLSEETRINTIIKQFPGLYYGFVYQAFFFCPQCSEDGERPFWPAAYFPALHAIRHHRASSSDSMGRWTVASPITFQPTSASGLYLFCMLSSCCCLTLNPTSSSALHFLLSFAFLSLSLFLLPA